MSSVKYDKRIAVVGGGISGMACLWGLRNKNYEIHLYEADSRLGGHANSIPFQGNGITYPVDTGFIVMNQEAYPKFSAFLEALHVQTVPTDMSFGVSEIDGYFEWGSLSLTSFIGKLSYLFSPWFWRFLFDIFRFNYFATDILSENRSVSDLDSSPNYTQNEDVSTYRDVKRQKLESIGQYLHRQHYSQQFKHYFIIPMVAAPWCTDPEAFSRDFPAEALIAFMAQHRLLSTVRETLHWRAFQRGSQTYIDAFLNFLQPKHHLHLNTPVESILRSHSSGIYLKTKNGDFEKFDHVVLAVHANQALKILGEGATALEQEILSAFQTSTNVCVLHSDTSLLPKRETARVSWNTFIQKSPEMSSSNMLTDEKTTLLDRSDMSNSKSHISKVSITFDMNRLQAIPSPGQSGSPGRVLVSMNPIRTPLSAQSNHIYYHPVLSSESMLASRYLHLINEGSDVSFAGAWMGYGFHEDGFAAGMQAADKIASGGFAAKRLPLTDLSTGWVPRVTIADTVIRGLIGVIQTFIELFERLSN